MTKEQVYEHISVLLSEAGLELSGDDYAELLTQLSAEIDVQLGPVTRDVTA